MGKCFLIVLLSVLLLGIVNAKEIFDFKSDFDFGVQNISSLREHMRFRRYKGEDVDCPNSSIMTFLAKILQEPIDVWRSFTLGGLLYDYYLASDRGAISLTLLVRSRGTITKALIAEDEKLDTQLMKTSGFSPEKKTVFITHGYLGTGDTDWLQRMANAYLKYEDVNVIVVSWGILAFGPGYVQAAKNTLIVANQTAEFAKEIVKTFPDNIKWGSVHLIGFSLGAHVVGMIGDHFKNNTNDPLTRWHVERITGLDPAHPCFTDTKYTLDKNDAPFVDIIHTNGNREFGATFGMLKAVGHVDFYLNGGEIQPGCASYQIVEFFLEVTTTFTMSQIQHARVAMCSHSNAPEYFIESLEVAASRQGSFLTGIKWDYDLCQAMYYTYTRKCDGICQQLGINAKIEPQGKYFVPTARYAPYYEIQDDDLEEISRELERLDEEGKPNNI
ncbi:phospholipase A1 [Diachasma alloeum]|uniref:phospholipase A1 n=1 Tax=Diachasma alloeum TaxID=454923 RepID=UPI000738318B|nr:phospholipase A1 [Diachasma alloeum]